LFLNNYISLLISIRYDWKKNKKNTKKIPKQLKILEITTKHSVGMYLSVEKKRHPVSASRRDASNIWWHTYGMPSMENALFYQEIIPNGIFLMYVIVEKELLRND
jgi:hypothetical protein